MHFVSRQSTCHGHVLCRLLLSKTSVDRAFVSKHVKPFCKVYSSYINMNRGIKTLGLYVIDFRE